MDAKTFIVRVYPGAGGARRIVGIVEPVPGGATCPFAGFDELRRILLRALPPSARNASRKGAVPAANRVQKQTDKGRSDTFKGRPRRTK